METLPIDALILSNNTGTNLNACYINAAIQTLYCIKEFRTFIVERNFLVPNQTVSQPICGELYLLFSNPEWLNNVKALRHLVAFYRGRPYYNDGSQQDSSEFLRDILECFYEEVSYLNIPGRAMYNNFFGIQSHVRTFDNPREQGKCPTCHTLPRSDTEPFQSIYLDLPNNSMRLQCLLDEHFSVSANSTRMKCSNCCRCVRNCPQTGPCRLKKSIEEKSIVKSPDILIITLQRYHNPGRKKETLILPDDIITLNGDRFVLNATVNHRGSSLNGGHYIAHIKSTDNSWIECDDAKITMSYQDISAKSNENYFLLYKKEIVPGSTLDLTAEWQELKKRLLPGGSHGHLDMKTGINYGRDAHLADPYPPHVILPRRDHQSDMSYQGFHGENQPFEAEDVAIVIDGSDEEVNQSDCQMSRDQVSQSENVVLGKRKNRLSKNKNTFSDSFSTDVGQKPSQSEKSIFYSCHKKKKIKFGFAKMS